MTTTPEPATDDIDWARVRDVIVTHTLITIRHRCHQLRSETTPDRVVTGLGEIGHLAGMAHMLPQLHPVTAHDLAFTFAYLPEIGLSRTAVHDALAQHQE